MSECVYGIFYDIKRPVKNCQNDHNNQLDFCHDENCFGYKDPKTHDSMGYPLSECSAPWPDVVSKKSKKSRSKMQTKNSKITKKYFDNSLPVLVEKRKSEKDTVDSEECEEKVDDNADLIYVLHDNQKTETVYRLIEGDYRAVKNCVSEHGNELEYCHDSSCFGYIALSTN